VNKQQSNKQISERSNISTLKPLRVISLNTWDRERIPAKPKINIKPMVIDKDNRAFQSQWKDTLCKCEKKLLNFLIGHLNNTIAETISAIQTKSDKFLREL